MSPAAWQRQHPPQQVLRRRRRRQPVLQIHYEPLLPSGKHCADGCWAAKSYHLCSKVADEAAPLQVRQASPLPMVLQDGQYPLLPHGDKQRRRQPPRRRRIRTSHQPHARKRHQDQPYPLPLPLRPWRAHPALMPLHGRREKQRLLRARRERHQGFKRARARVPRA